MKQFVESFLHSHWFINIVVPSIIIASSFLLGLFVKRIVLVRVKHWVKKTKLRLDDVLLDAVQPVILLWAVLGGVYCAINVAGVEALQTAFVQKVFVSVLIFSFFWFLVQLLGRIFIVYGDLLQERLPAASIVQNAVKVFVLALGVLIILQTLGISITPIITTLGIGGLAVALALQDTLANLFAGFHIVATKRVKPGDYIRLDSGQEGYVVDVNWRDTIIRQLPNNLVIIPNSKLSSAIIVNLHRPQKEIMVTIDVGVDYASDLEQVERVTLDVAHTALQEVSGGIKTFKPFLRYHSFGDSSISFTVYLRCEEFFDTFLLLH